MTDQLAFHLPERPYSPIDALNRRAAAVGSPPYAMATGHADYNGHHVTLAWNSFRKYYVAEYFWAGRVVIARGDFASCLRAVLTEYNRGALGSSANVYPREDDAEALALCEATDLLVPGKEDARTWYTWRHQCAAEAARDCAHPGAAAMVFDWDLMQTCETRQAYEDALRERHGRVYQ